MRVEPLLNLLPNPEHDSSLCTIAENFLKPNKFINTNPLGM